MANFLDVPELNYSYPGQTTLDVLLKPTTQHSVFTELFDTISGIKSLHQLGLIGSQSKIVKADDLSCGRTTTGSGIPITNRTLKVCNMKVFFQQCGAEVFKNTIYEEWLRSGNAKQDLTNTSAMPIIDALLRDAISRDIFRIMSWGDEADADNDYNQCNGMFRTLLNATGDYAADACVERAPTPLPQTGALADGEALASLIEIDEIADATLYQDPNKKLYVTRSIFQNLQKSYESTTSGSDIQFKLLPDGSQGGLMFRGIPLIVNALWDKDLKDPTNPFFNIIKHTIILTTPLNNVIGFEEATNTTEMRAWYSLDDDIMNFSAKFALGYQFRHCDQTVIAF